jgi:hypothetical protein
MLAVRVAGQALQGGRDTDGATRDAGLAGLSLGAAA